MLFSNGNNEKLVLLLGVESCAVHGSLILMEKDKIESNVPKVIFTCAIPVPWKPHTDSRYLIKTTEKAIREAVETTLRHLHILSSASKDNDLPKKISSVHFSLSSPWMISQAKLISTTFEKETKITHEYITELIEKERAKMIPSQSEPIRVVEEKIFDVRLNGYSISDWQNKEARKLDVSFTVSVVGTHTMERFASLCEHIVNPHKVRFHSSLLLQFIGAEKSLITDKNYAIIHVHGELTDVAIINDRACVFFGSYPFGTHTFIRKISASTKINHHVTDSMITLYTARRLDPVQNKKVYSSIENISGGWTGELSKVFSISTQKIQNFNKIILLACAHENCFAEILQKAYPKIKITLVSESNLLPVAIHSME
ncbi:MAG: hypothetical protein WC666_00345 [Candidatus Paceibacterota bacterium]|jgi:cell division ATPase FtsA